MHDGGLILKKCISKDKNAVRIEKRCKRNNKLQIPRGRKKGGSIMRRKRRAHTDAPHKHLWDVFPDGDDAHPESSRVPQWTPQETRCEKRSSFMLSYKLEQEAARKMFKALFVAIMRALALAADPAETSFPLRWSAVKTINGNGHNTKRDAHIIGCREQQSWVMALLLVSQTDDITNIP